VKILRAGLVLLTLGCANKQTGAVDPDADSASTAPVTIHVTNNHGYPVEISVAGQGISYRLGTVLPGGNSKFELRAGTVGHGPIDLIARGRPGEQPYRAGGLMLNPGDIVDFDIATHMLNSMATVRPRRDS
jgi:hypothetical protein